MMFIGTETLVTQRVLGPNKVRPAHTPGARHPGRDSLERQSDDQAPGKGARQLLGCARR